MNEFFRRYASSCHRSGSPARRRLQWSDTWDSGSKRRTPSVHVVGTYQSKRRTALLDMCCFVLLLLVLQAIWRPGNSFQAGGFNLASTCNALAISAVVDTVQGVLHLYQRPRRYGVFLKRFRCALGGGG